jgi:mannose/fructose/N-acetylgalactosamine-specific phosphotransferase system component IIB
VTADHDFLLVRVDERLLHGQVAVAWASALRPRWIYVVDDEAAGTPWDAALYRASPPPGSSVEVLPLHGFAALFASGGVQAAGSFVLVRSPASALRLVESGVPVRALNIGGLRRGQGSREILPYVWLLPEDESALAALSGRGIRILARDLPMNPEVDLAGLVGGTGDGREDRA